MQRRSQVPVRLQPIVGFLARLLALPADSLTPRLSWVGAVLLFGLLGIAGSALAVFLMVLDVGQGQRQDAARRMQELEIVFGAVQAEFDRFASQSRALNGAPQACRVSMRRALLDMSLHSDHARRFLWLAADGAPACVPGGDRLEASAERDLREAARNSAKGLRIVRSMTNRLYLVAAPTEAGNLVAELSEARWRRPLGGFVSVPDEMLTLMDGRGVLLHGERPGPVSGLWPIMMAMLQRQLCSTVVSNSFHLVLELAPSTHALSAMIIERVAAAWLVAALLSLAGVASINRAVQDRFSIVRRLRRALRRREIEPVVQPFVDAASGRCVGAEVLMRWRHPIRGLLVPAEFLAIAEQTGLITDMTWQLLAKSRDRLDPIVRRDPDLLFSFNFGVQMLRDPSFVARLDEEFRDCALRPANVCIELLERDAVDDRSIDMLHRLRRAGYKVAIDDFGTGQSSLALLSQIGFDTLKIDREFVRAIDGDSMNRPVLTAIIDLAERLGVRTTAEGVETIEQHRYLLARGVDVLQGYLIARPMPISEFESWLQRNRVRPTYANGEDGTGFDGSDEGGRSEKAWQPGAAPARPGVTAGQAADAGYDGPARVLERRLRVSMAMHARKQLGAASETQAARAAGVPGAKTARLLPI
ncbi:MAG: EAL domain-containing protein [Burkholderiaceae bacterium]